MSRPHNGKGPSWQTAPSPFVGRAGTRTSYRQPGQKATGEVEPVREIHIDPEAFGCGFDVLVLPDGIMGREFPDHAAARAWAADLNSEYGWRVVDNCPERLAVLP